MEVERPESPADPAPSRLVNLQAHSRSSSPALAVPVIRSTGLISLAGVARSDVLNADAQLPSRAELEQVSFIHFTKIG